MSNTKPYLLNILLHLQFRYFAYPSGFKVEACEAQNWETTKSDTRGKNILGSRKVILMFGQDVSLAGTPFPIAGLVPVTRKPLTPKIHLLPNSTIPHCLNLIPHTTTTTNITYLLLLQNHCLSLYPSPASLFSVPAADRVRCRLSISRDAENLRHLFDLI